MPITLGSNITSLRTQRRLAEASQQVGSIFERLSSGQRINRASDDAAGLAIADSLNTESRIATQTIRNINDGMSLIAISQTAITSMKDVIVRLEELAEQSANGVYTSEQRAALDGEAQSLRSEIHRIGATAEFNGKKLFQDNEEGISLQLGGSTEDHQITIGNSLPTIDGVNDGTFTQGAIFTDGNGEIGITTGDFNGDGNLDFAQSLRFQNQLTVYLGDGTGNFTQQSNVSTGTRPVAITSGDIDNDGNVDIIVSNDNSDNLGILLGNGDGTFQTQVAYTPPLTHDHENVKLIDLDNDGNLDLVGRLGGNLYTALGNGDGTFGTQNNYSVGGRGRGLDFADLNGDGNLDLVTNDRDNNRYRVYLGNGNGTFAAQSVVSTDAIGSTNRLDLADVNDDGITDLVLATTSSFTTYLGDGDGTFTEVGQTDLSVGVALIHVFDFDGDGIMDVMTNEGQTHIAYGNNDGTFQESEQITSFSSFYNLGFGDFTNDGAVDFIINNQTSYFFEGGAQLGGVVVNFSLLTQESSRNALATLKEAREELSIALGELGAEQSRLNTALQVIQVKRENTTAAESRIRDADIAQESARLTLQTILQQAASSVLAQANQQPAIALQLL